MTTLTDCRTCSIDDCDQPARGRGWCNTHYLRWRRNGDPLKLVRVVGVCSIVGCGRPHSARGWCDPHYERWRLSHLPKKTAPPTLRASSTEGRRRAVERFWAKVDRRGPGECWPWVGALTTEGYGRMHVNGRETGAHRIAYELLNGPIPDGLVLDHLCRVRHCANPAHLEAVTNAENIRRGLAPEVQRRKTHCPNNHPYDAENTYVSPSGARKCRQCTREQQRRAYKRSRSV